VSGGFNSSQDQLRTESVDDFSSYLVGVVKQLEKAHGIKIDTIDPMNEPNTPYWGTSLNSAGQPVGGRQEGAHMGPELQQKVVQSLSKALAGADTGAVISAMDETNPSTFASNWNSYSADAKADVGQLNVHTYGTGQRTAVRDIAKGEDKPLWMSETGGSWLDGQNFTSMQPGLGHAGRAELHQHAAGPRPCPAYGQRPTRARTRGLGVLAARGGLQQHEARRRKCHRIQLGRDSAALRLRGR
jgi:hypothetical protein